MDKTLVVGPTIAILRNATKDSTNLGCVECVDIKYAILDVAAHTRISVTMAVTALKKKLLLNITISVVRTTKDGNPNSSSANAIPTI